MLLITREMNRAMIWFAACVCLSAGCSDVPRDDAGTDAAAVPESESCSGDDERAITGYALGEACSVDKVIVPGVCAEGAQRNASSGTGTMLCFVTGEGSYYWAFVRFGESVTGSGAKHGYGELFANQLNEGQSARCEELIGALRTASGAAFNALSREFIAAPCR